MFFIDLGSSRGWVEKFDRASTAPSHHGSKKSDKKTNQSDDDDDDDTADLGDDALGSFDHCH